MECPRIRFTGLQNSISMKLVNTASVNVSFTYSGLEGRNMWFSDQHIYVRSPMQVSARTAVPVAAVMTPHQTSRRSMLLSALIVPALLVETRPAAAGYKEDVAAR